VRFPRQKASGVPELFFVESIARKPERLKKKRRGKAAFRLVEKPSILSRLELARNSAKTQGADRAGKARLARE